MSVRNWLITGSSGFLGRSVVEALGSVPGVRSVGVGRPGSRRPAAIDEFVTIDPYSGESWKSALRIFQPAVLLHLAGRTPPAEVAVMDRDNVELTRVLVAALENHGAPIRLVHCGSAAELGDVPEHLLPAGESIEPLPVSDYGRTKWAATRVVLNARPPVDPVVGRIFNPIGPRQPSNQVFGRYARAFLAEGHGRTAPWAIPGLSNRRDFIDVRDAAMALIALGQSGRSALIYHIGAGISHSVGQGLQILAELAGCRSAVVADDSSPPRGPNDSIADIRRIVAETGWRPQIGFRRSLEDLWSEVVRQAAHPE